MNESLEHGSASEAAAVRDALAAGRLDVPDPKSGFHHAMYAVCPADGTHAPLRRIVRGAQGAITQVTARCPRCGNEFTATPEEIHLL